MSRLTELLAAAGELNSQLGRDLAEEVRALMNRRSFGLVFERHQPEAVELPGQPVRRGDKVHVLTPRGEKKSPHPGLWRVDTVESRQGEKTATLAKEDAADEAADGAEEPETITMPTTELVVVAEFSDKIYPGLVPTGKVERGGDKPFHTVINGENYHVLKMLTYTHRHKVDAIYIDPPYNTGAKDWKYNNDYVGSDDAYRHSKWLAMMERRLLIAKELLNPEDSVLICTIDEKEYLRLGQLLEQTFPEARIQMVSDVINPAAVARADAFGRTDEYIYFVKVGENKPIPLHLSNEWTGAIRSTVKDKLHWNALKRTGTNALREDRPGLFYPVFISEVDGAPIFHSVGEPFYGEAISEVSAPPGTTAIWPIRADGSYGRFQIGPDALRDLIKKGYAKMTRWRGEETAIYYLKSGEQKKVETGLFPIIGHAPDGSVEVDATEYVPEFLPGTAWQIPSHDASRNGSNLISALLSGRKFPFPKSLYTVEDTLRFFIKNKPNAVVLDFFAGSGTTAHAVMRLNKQDGGRRQCISVTNNEVSADEQKKLREKGLRPGDAE